MQLRVDQYSPDERFLSGIPIAERIANDLLDPVEFNRLQLTDDVRKSLFNDSPRRMHIAAAVGAMVPGRLDISQQLERVVSGTEGMQLADRAHFLEHEADPEKVKQWLSVLMHSRPTTRNATISHDFRTVFSRDPQQFYWLMREIGQQNPIATSLQRAVECDEALTPNHFLVPLTTTHSIFMAAIREYQSNDYESGGYSRRNKQGDFVHMLAHHAPQNSDADAKLITTRAGIPVSSPEVRKYASAIEEFYLQNPERGGEVYDQLKYAFRMLARSMYGIEKVPYFTKGTTEAFKAFCNAFWQDNPQSHFIALTPGEYLPMLQATPEEKRHQLHFDSPDFDTDEILPKLREKAKRIIQETGGGAIPIMLLLSSNLRRGGEVLPIHDLCADIEKLNEELAPQCGGNRVFVLAVDGAQDHRIIKNASIVFHSKRHGEANSGIVIVTPDHFGSSSRQPNTSMDTFFSSNIAEAFRDRSGFQVFSIASLVGTLHAIQSRLDHGIEQLMTNFSLWNVRFGNRFMQSEIQEAQRIIQQSKVLRDTIRLQAPELCEDQADWNMDAVLRLEICDEANITVGELVSALQDEDVVATGFHLEQMDAYGYDKTFREVMEYFQFYRDGNEFFNIEDFITLVEEFEHFYQDHIVTRLLPPPDERDDPEHVCAYFSEAVKKHEFIRLYLSVGDNPKHLSRVFERAETAIAKLLHRKSLS